MKYPAGRMRALQGGNQVGEYTFNGAGQRIKKVTQTETRIFHYDLLGHLIAETNQTGQMLAEYVYLGDQLLAMIKPGELVYYYHNDHLGTPQVLTDATQTVAWKATYTPFGEAVTSIATVENPFRFPGQYYDAETGLHYNYYRYYNPPIGRYLTPDPIGLWGGLNLFVYTANNPVRFTDPKGLLIAPWHFVITYVAAWNSDSGVWDSLKLAWEVTSQDPPPWVKMDKSADEANTHAMIGKLPTGTYQTPEEALAEINEIIEKGDPRGLHATQDFPVHNLETMEDWDWNWSTVKHVLKDIFDIPSVIEAYKRTKKALNKKPCK